MKSANHLVILTPGFAADEMDALCIPPLQMFLPRFRELYPDWKISILALQYPYRKGRYAWQGFEIMAFGGENKWRRKWITRKRAARYFAELHAAHPVTCLHSLWLEECTQLGHRLARQYDLPQVATIMGQDAQSCKPYLQGCDLAAMQVVAISERAATRFAATMGQRPQAVIPWGLAPDATVTPQVVDRPIDLLGVGGLVPVKAWERFLEVVAAVAQQQGPVRALLVGEGPERARLEARVQALGLQGQVTFTGLLHRSEVLRHMSQSKILLHTATYEGQGYVFLEALANGAQVISGPVGIASASVRWQVCPDVTAMAKAVVRTLAGPRDTAPDFPYPLDATVEAMAQLYGAHS